MAKWIRMRTTIAGPGICAHSGDVIEVADDFADAMIKSGNAVLEVVARAPQVELTEERVVGPKETAIVEPTEDETVGPQEDATLPRRGRGRRRN